MTTANIADPVLAIILPSTRHSGHSSNDYDNGLFLGLEQSSLGPSSSCASPPNGSRGVKKTVCLPSLLSFPPATSPDMVIVTWL